MTNLAGTPVELQITEEPELLGGVLIEIGDLRIDATARGRLDRLHDSLLPEGWDGAFSSRQRGNTEGAH
jgi:F0F1-type ATP synthase delta subunit